MIAELDEFDGLTVGDSVTLKSKRSNSKHFQHDGKTMNVTEIKCYDDVYNPVRYSMDGDGCAGFFWTRDELTLIHDYSEEIILH